MKTINEESEFIRNLSLSLLGVSKSIDYVTCADREKYAFLKGVEFAQRWISIEESMPEDHSAIRLFKKGKHLEITKPVLVKYDDGRFSIDCRRNAGDSYNFWKIDHTGIVEWRPIELE